MADEGLQLAGDLYIDRLTDQGESTGYNPDLVNVVKFEIKHNGKLDKRMGRRKATHGQTVGAVSQPEPNDLTIECDSANDAQFLAMAMMGSVASLEISAGSVTGELSTAGSVGNWIDLANSKISNVVITSPDDVTTYVEGTDYEIMPTLGMWRPLAGGAITEKTQVKLAYDHEGVTGKQVNAGDTKIIKTRLKLDGENLETGQPVLCEVDEAIFVSNAVIDLFASKFVVLPLAGTMRTLPGNTTPYRYQILD